VIASVAFRNFKALRNTSLRLSPFNLVIGANGSGKTSLIQALQRLRTLAKLPLGNPAAVTRSGGPEITIAFDEPHAGVTARLGCVSDVVCDLLRVESPSPAEWDAVKARLGTMRSYVFDHEAMAAPALSTAGAGLASNGANLPAVLAARRRQAPAEFARLEAELVRLLPEFTGIALHEDAGGRVSLALRIGNAEAPVAADNLSQGVFYLLGILVLSFDPAPPAVVCIEEIDRGMHPRMLREVRDALYRLSYPASFGEARSPVQVIATTHSPYLLDLFREHPEEIVITQKHGHEARFERLADRADLKELLSEGSLGDMWFSGILGGVPEEP
jgi:predicted ATPase